MPRSPGLILLGVCAGASLLVFANKQDLAGALSLEEIKEVCCVGICRQLSADCILIACFLTDPQARLNCEAALEHSSVLCCERTGTCRGR